MIDHEVARTYASARADGELLEAGTGAALDEHLGRCAECATYTTGIAALSQAVAALPRERSPSALPGRVLDEIARTGAPRRRWARVAPALAAAVVGVVVTVLVLQPLPHFPLPDAGAAAPLTRITSLYMEREIRDFDATGTLESVTRERIWFRAPASTRIERVIERAGAPRVDELEIIVPGKRYLKTPATEFVEVNTAPSATSLPEPLSPALPFYGRRAGPGPLVAGRRTVRVILETPSERRLALLDAERFTVVGAEESVVLAKETLSGAVLRTAKRTLEVEYDVAVPASRFAVPRAEPLDRGFRTARVENVPGAPRSLPRGFGVVRSGTSAFGNAVLLARGAFSVLIEIQAVPQNPRPDERAESVRVGSRPATVVVGFYSLPRVTFEHEGRGVTISAPLARDALVELAAQMYPER